MITAADIRQRYIDFFVQRGHQHVPSAPIVPPDDPTLLFTTAGMVQFKSLYSSAGELPYLRAVSVQKCLRAGGKGSDLENVGRTLRHHTFFEMLGNFSFGDYFKKDAIEWAWEFCTGKDWLGLPPERIWATVYGKRDANGKWTLDEEAEKFWKENTGLINPVVRLDEEENYWGPAGDTGACGPCSEIRFFMGSDEELRRYQKLANGDEAAGEPGGEKIAHDIVEEGDLFLEIWNLVFPQFDQQLDGSRPALRNRGIDTGAGLERMTTACQMIQSGGKIWSPYETDLLEPIVSLVSELSGLPYPTLRTGEEASANLRKRGYDPDEVRLAINACADHARTLTFALTEGIVPSNEGRGYVIRRILRRAARFGKKIGLDDPFLYKLVAPVVEIMGPHYPELLDRKAHVVKLIRIEEERFSRTLHLGMEMLEGLIKGRTKGESVTGEEAYRLYDTYGFPLDLAIEIAEERGLDVDIAGYERCLAEGRARARASWKGAEGGDLAAIARDLTQENVSTEFVGYDETEREATVVALARGNERVESLEEGQAGLVVLDKTGFYGEGGGQTGDTGVLLSPEGIELFLVRDTQKTDDGLVFHYGEPLTRIAVGDSVLARVDAERRARTIRNHSATHLLQGALKRLIGTHVTQSGSYVGPDHLRFDFTNPEAVGEKRLREIENVVNEQVRQNHRVTTEVLSLDEAKATGAIAPFGEKYGATVRVIRMGEFSTEFCAGTHVRATGDIGSFIITGESSVASGIRRIEAKTGAGAAQSIAADRRAVSSLSRQLAVAPDQLSERVASLQDEVRTLQRELGEAKDKQLREASGDLEVVDIGPAKACVAWLDGADMGGLKSTMDRLKSRHPSGFVAVLGSGGGGKALLVVGATDDLKGSAFEAGKVIREIAPIFGGRGGGKPHFAQAGGKDADALRDALKGGDVLETLKKLA